MALHEGRTDNRLIREGRVAAHLVVTSGDGAKVVAAFPAGNMGTGLWFEGAPSIAMEGELTSVERGDGTVDLAPFADGDGLPEMSQLALVDGALFVTVQRLDRRRGFAPTGSSRMVVVDTATDAVSGEIVLHGGNPFGDASGIGRDPATGHLVIASAGNIFRVGDGGLERVDPATRTAAGTTTRSSGHRSRSASGFPCASNRSTSASENVSTDRSPPACRRTTWTMSFDARSVNPPAAATSWRTVMRASLLIS